MKFLGGLVTGMMLVIVLVMWHSRELRQVLCEVPATTAPSSAWRRGDVGP
jgi:hypothetical protein